MKTILITLVMMMSAAPAFAVSTVPAKEYVEYNTNVEKSGVGSSIEDKLNELAPPTFGTYDDLIRRARSVSMMIGKMNDQQLLLTRNFIGLPPTLTAKETKEVLADRWRHSARGSDIDFLRFEMAIGRALIDNGGI